MTQDISKYLDDTINGYKTIIANKKQRGIMKLQEGRLPLTFTGYLELSLLLMGLVIVGSLSGPAFGWCYFIITWNLMCRSNSTANIHLNHIQSQNDCMTITFAKSKGDQTGEKEGEKHVYGNPLNPQICPILSMAVWVFTRTFVQLNEDSLRLFKTDS